MTPTNSPPLVDWLSTRLASYPTKASAGRALGVTSVAVGQWLTSARIPGPAARDALISVLGLSSREAGELRRLCDEADRARRASL